MVVVVRFLNKSRVQIQVDGRIKFAFLGLVGVALFVIVVGLAYFTEEKDIKAIFILFALLLLFIPIHSATRFRRSVYMYEIDRALRSVRRSDFRGMSEHRVVGEFLAVALLSTVVRVGKGRVPLHKLRLVCEFGVVELFTMSKKSAMLKNGQAIANWLAVPFKDTGWLAHFDFADDTKLFPAN